MNNLALLFTFVLFASLSHAIVLDYCVGDPTLPMGPEGYACKDPSKVTTDDFVYTGFRGERTTGNPFNNNITFAFAEEFPGLNGLGISMARLDLGVNGVIPIHSHRTSEVIVVIRGTIIAGFIDTNDRAFYKRLIVGDVMVFPQGMLHFQVNVGKIPALAYVSLNSASPGLQITTTSLFLGNLPGDIVEKVTLLSHAEVRRMKRAFGN